MGGSSHNEFTVNCNTIPNNFPSTAYVANSYAGACANDASLEIVANTSPGDDYANDPDVHFYAPPSVVQFKCGSEILASFEVKCCPQ
jgi:hypothetical protein